MSLPLAEFHLHLEAALSWAAFAQLAGRAEPAAPWLDRLPRPFDTFEDFLQPWRRDLAPVLRLPGAYPRWLLAAAHGLARLGVRYAELSIAVSFLEKLGHPPEATARALAAAAAEAERAAGVTVRLFAAIHRDAAPAANARRVEDWLRWLGPDLAGIDLHGYELEGPTATQKPAFDVARAAGLHLRAHAGEHGTVRDVRAAIEILGVASINHGLRAADDPGLLRELAARGIAVHLCPTSNLLLGLVPSYGEYPLRRFLDAGVRVTLNSDDPLLFGTDLPTEFARLRAALTLRPDEMRALYENAWRAALVPPAARAAHLAEVRAAPL